MIERTEQRFGLKPKWLAGDTAYGSGTNLNWLVKDKDIAPHIPVIDKSKREDGTFSREDFTFDKERNVYVCPANKTLTTTGTVIDDGETLRYLASTSDCRGCLFKAQCCPKALSAGSRAASTKRRATLPARWPRPKRSNNHVATEERVEMLFAHLKRILKLEHFPLNVERIQHCGSSWYIPKTRRR